MAKPAMRITTTGPIFNGSVTNRLLNQAGRGAVKEMMELGEQRLDLTLRPRPSGVFLSIVQARKGQASTGNYRRNIHGMQRNLEAVITDGGVIYGPWLEGIGSRNQLTRFKGYASFRRVTQWLNKQAPRILQIHRKKLVKRLNG